MQKCGPISPFLSLNNITRGLRGERVHIGYETTGNPKPDEAPSVYMTQKRGHVPQKAFQEGGEREREREKMTASHVIPYHASRGLLLIPYSLAHTIP